MMQWPAWRQLHRHLRGGTPIPLELTFPWGTQAFWGGDREYLFVLRQLGGEADRQWFPCFGGVVLEGA